MVRYSSMEDSPAKRVSNFGASPDYSHKAYYIIKHIQYCSPSLFQEMEFERENRSPSPSDSNSEEGEYVPYFADPVREADRLRELRRRERARREEQQRDLDSHERHRRERRDRQRERQRRSERCPENRDRREDRIQPPQIIRIMIPVSALKCIDSSVLQSHLLILLI